MNLKQLIKFFIVRAFEVLIAVLLITFMPNVPPDAKFSQSYSVAPASSLEGKLALNERLNGAELWHKGDLHGPEAFAAYNGELYTSIHGDIVKLVGNHVMPVVKFGKPCKGLYQEQICGRPLGLTFDKHGALYAADAYYGIFKVDVKTGKKLQLVSMDHEIEGKKPKLANSIAVMSNGDLYWTDSSTEFDLQDGLFDMFADGSGRLIHYNAKTKKNSVLIDGLHFANGVMLSNDESFVIVAETGRSRIHRYYLKGAKKETNDIFIDGLPGLPDNLQTDGQDGFFVPLVVAKDSMHPSPIQIFGPFPLARKFFARIFGLAQLGFKVLDQIYPNEWAERGKHFVGHFTSFNFFLPSRVTVLRVSKNGDILESLHALDKRISGISEAFVFKDHLYLGSPFNDYIARVPLDKADLKHLATAKQVPPSVTQAPPAASTTTQATPTTKPTTQAPPPTTTKTPPPTTTQPPPPTTTTAPPPTTTRAPPPSPRTTESQTRTTPPPKQVPTTSPPVKRAPPTTAPPAASKQTSPPPPKQTPTSPPPSPSKTVPPTVQSKPTPSTLPPKPAPSTTPPPTTQSPPKQTPPASQPPAKEQPKVMPGKDLPKNAK